MRRGVQLALSLSGVAWLSYVPAAHALDQDKVLLRAFTGLTYDSNLFRISSDRDPGTFGLSSRSDMYLNYGGGVKLNMPIGRQLLTADVSASQTRYSENSTLDFTGYNLRGGWYWQVGNRWNGELSGGASQGRQTYGFGSVGAFVPRLLRTYDATARANYALTPHVDLQTALNGFSFAFTDQDLQFADFHSIGLDLGATYRSSPGNSTGLRLSYGTGSYPNRFPSTTAVFDHAYKQYTAAVVVDWQLTGTSRLHGDAGYTIRRHDLVPARDFSAPTGTLTYDWTLSGKTSVRASLYENVSVVENLAATYVRRIGLNLGATYQPTGKVALQADSGVREESQVGEPFQPGLLQRSDTVWSVSLGASYQPIRTVTVSANLRQEQRTSNVQFGDYQYFAASITAQVQF